MNFYTALLFIISFSFVKSNTYSQTPFVYHDAREFSIIGSGFADASGYHRLPLRYKTKVRSDVWDLSLNSAGIALRFSTNSSDIAVKWKIGNDVHFPHVAETLVKGVDLYCRQNGKWFYAGVGKPYLKEGNQAVLIKGMDSTMKEFMLYLPMYETVDSVYIGVMSEAVIEKPGELGFKKIKPIIFYGTSIVQGASAMRPGMAYPSIISRHLNIETINFGFSGNGRMEKEMAEAMAEIDASCYVIDCGPNLKPQLAKERTVPFIRLLRQKRPTVPILLVENIIYPQRRFVKNTKQNVEGINKVFKESFATLRKEGMKNIFYLPAENLIGTDGEATVDGVHLTDLGFMRIAGVMGRKIKTILVLK